MSVLIKGMEMPTACSVGCPIFHEGTFNDYCGYGWKKVPREIEKPDWCPLIEVPEHGDLIDRDALKWSFVHGRWDDVYISRADIKEAPIVIPADKDGET